MAFINENYLKLKAGYLFPEIARRVKAFASENIPGKNHPHGHRRRHRTPRRPPACLPCTTRSNELAHRETFRGYGPEQGYDFLRNAIVPK